MGKAMIAMSGGVDSSVAVRLMQEQGADCVGVMMSLFSTETDAQKAAAAAAGAVAERLGIPFHVVDYHEAFKKEIIDSFVRAYLHGQTPNPCIVCNKTMKFGKLLELAEEQGCDRIVTGHYARIEKDGELFRLKKAEDQTKDQSYMLYRLSQEQLGKSWFPLGEYQKSEIRELAESWGFVNARQKDSQDICFVPDGDYARVIEEYTKEGSRPGPFVDTNGNVLGRHRGIIHYTVGQRRGLGIAAPEPLYVCRIDPEQNTIELGFREQLFDRELDADEFNWIAGTVPNQPVRCRAKIRYHHAEELCTVYPEGKETAHIVFEEPQRAITPGQSVVLYDGDYVLGGGTILPKRNKTKKE